MNSVINKMGFVPYFLIVWDFVSQAKTRIMVGPAAGRLPAALPGTCLASPTLTR